MALWKPESPIPLKVAAWYDPQKGIDKRVCFLKIIWNSEVRLIPFVDLHHEDTEGETHLHYFSVADKTQHYKLCFNTRNLTWYLVEIYVPD